jgi:hypothetical protein
VRRNRRGGLEESMVERRLFGRIFYINSNNLTESLQPTSVLMQPSFPSVSLVLTSNDVGCLDSSGKALRVITDSPALKRVIQAHKVLGRTYATPKVCNSSSTNMFAGKK